MDVDLFLDIRTSCGWYKDPPLLGVSKRSAPLGWYNDPHLFDGTMIRISWVVHELLFVCGFDVNLSVRDLCHSGVFYQHDFQLVSPAFVKRSARHGVN